MSDDNMPVCRLCLEIVYDGKFQEVESIIIVLQNMLPELNFSVSSQPVICNKCMEVIQKLFSFKSACLETEKYLQNSRPSEKSTVYLEEAVYNNTENKIKMEKTDKEKICRFCLQILEGDLCTQLGVLEEDMLGKCLAELDLTITDNPVICGTCLESLQDQFNFIMFCLDVEARINNYCSLRETNSDDPVNLHDVLTLQTPVDKIDHNNSFNGLIGVKVKLEDYGHSQNAESFKEFEQVFIEGGVKSESTLDANLDIFDEVISKNPNCDELVTKKLPHELDHNYSYIIQPSLNKGLVNTSRLSKNYRMKHFIRPRKEVRTVQNLKKTIRQLERKLKYYKQKYRRVSEKLYNLHCVLEELRNKNLISNEAYEKILTGK